MKKKIAVIGASGTIGAAVVQKLRDLGHEVLEVSRNGEYKIDITDTNSIANFYQQAKNLDAIVVTTGKVKFAHLIDMNNETYMFGLQNKLMGSINLVLEGLKHLNKNGSFTLTSGIINREPIRLGTSAAMVNGALEAFVKSAACELPNDLRINIVSPTILTESYDKYHDYFAGFKSVSAQKVADAYVKSILGIQTGNVYIVE